MIVSTMCCSCLVPSSGRKTHFSEKLSFHSLAGRNSWFSLPCMPAADDFQGTSGRGVTGAILKAGAAWSPGGASARSLEERRRINQVSGHASCRGASEFTSDWRLSRLSDAAERMVAESNGTELGI